MKKGRKALFSCLRFESHTPACPRQRYLSCIAITELLRHGVARNELAVQMVQLKAGEEQVVRFTNDEDTLTFFNARLEQVAEAVISRSR